MILLLLTYLYKRFGHRLNFSLADFYPQKGRASMQLQPIPVRANQQQILRQRG